MNVEQLVNNTKEYNFGWYLARILVGPFYKLYAKPIIINKEYIPKKGPIIFAGNHTHKFDPFLVGLSSKRTAHYLAKNAYDKGKLSFIFRIVGTIPVDRERKDPVAEGRAIKILNKGGAVGVFPEGTRNKTDKLLLPFKFGVVSMAQKTGASIVPFAITGSFGKNGRPIIKYGKPFKVAKKYSLEIANKKLFDTVKDILLEIKNNKKTI